MHKPWPDMENYHLSSQEEGRCTLTKTGTLLTSFTRKWKSEMGQDRKWNGYPPSIWYHRARLNTNIPGCMLTFQSSCTKGNLRTLWRKSTLVTPHTVIILSVEEINPLSACLKYYSIFKEMTLLAFNFIDLFRKYRQKFEKNQNKWQAEFSNHCGYQTLEWKAIYRQNCDHTRENLLPDCLLLVKSHIELIS